MQSSKIRTFLAAVFILPAVITIILFFIGFLPGINTSIQGEILNLFGLCAIAGILILNKKADL